MFGGGGGSYIRQTWGGACPKSLKTPGLRDLSIKVGLVTGLDLIGYEVCQSRRFGYRTGFDWLRDLSIKAGLVTGLDLIGYGICQSKRVLVTGLDLIGYGICQSRWVWFQDWV